MKQIPKFKNEGAERDFWGTHDTTDYIESMVEVKGDFINLKPSTKTITIRVTESLLNSLKLLAHKQDVPYQSLIKIYLSEKIKEKTR
ncbi:BrnA antitoxin family protein [Patescibacteria group bacterium]|nr:BrnA antitoxin family protein [Patescibacteria group bacterium]